MKIGRNLECSPIVAGDFLPTGSRELLPMTNPAAAILDDSSIRLIRSV
jgi:hypothetical protein